MAEMMRELAEFMGFNFQAQTFPELAMYYFMAVAATAIVASVIKVMFYISCNTNKLARW